MPAKGVKGNKGGGRRTAKEERLVKEVVNKCWERVLQNLNGKRLRAEEKDMIALEVVKRTAPKNIDLTTKGEKLPAPLLAGKSNDTSNHSDEEIISDD